MEFKLLIQNYINYCSTQNQFAIRSLERYNYLLSVYYEFLFVHKRINDGTFIPYLNRVIPDDIFQSLEYYTESRPVKSEDTARLYVSVIKGFIQYLNMIKKIHSVKLIESFGLKDDDPNSFNFKYNEFLEYLYKTNKIITRVKDKLPSESEILEIIECCNQNIKLEKIENLHRGDQAYDRFVSGLIVKLILLTGATFTPTIKSIKKGDLNLDKGALKIGNFQIHLPFDYRLQFKEYMKICCCKSNSDPLFLFYGNKMIDTPNEIISIFSHKVGITSTKSLAKYAILEMLDAGVDKDTILEFTGYGEAVYKSCKEISDLGKAESKMQFIDNTIKCLPLFDIL